MTGFAVPEGMTMVKEMREIKKGKSLPGDWHLRKSTPNAFASV
jgi:hypothetical protein